MERLNHADAGAGFEEDVKDFGEEEVHDPDTLLSLARAEGVDLANFAPDAQTDPKDVFNTKYDTDQDLDDLDNLEDDLSGDYY